jgi:phospholipid/cholesterol/gamma-HCH transport system substrate-binding protein
MGKRRGSSVLERDQRVIEAPRAPTPSPGTGTKPKRRGLSILERNQRVIGTVALLLILIGTVLGLLLQGGLLTPTYRVTAFFTDAAGIVEGDNVTVAGLPAGTVKDIRIERGRVAMELGIEKDVVLSRDSSAEIVIETLLGRRSVAVLPGEGEAPLEDGDVIPVVRTTTPVDITELSDIQVELLEASDADAFEGFLTDIAEITEGKAAEVEALVTGLNRVLEAVDARRLQLARLIESLRTIATTLGQRDDNIVRIIDNLNVVLGNLEERQQELETLLESTASASVETADLVRRNRAVLDSTLHNLTTDLEVLGRHQLDLASGIAYLENSVQGYSSVGYSQGHPNHWANIFVRSLGPASTGVFGECGLMDKLVDEYFDDGNCNTNPRGTGGPAMAPGTEPGEGPPGPGGLPEVPGADVPGLPVDEPTGGSGLPCTVTDVIDTATGAGGCEA